MLSGRPPFSGNSNKEVLSKVLYGNYDFKQPQWLVVSSEAKDLVKKLLERSIDKRLSAEQALNHPWIKQQRTKDNDKVIINENVIEDIKRFMNSIRFKKAILTFIASRMPEDQIKEFRDIFNKFDLNGDGVLSIDELKQGLLSI